MTDSDLAATVRAGYAFTGPVLELGALVTGQTCDPSAKVRIPLPMMNRHGLVAGATGTGKTKTLQGLTEQLSAAGVPVFVADMKGDLSGLGAAVDADGPAAKRDAELGMEYKPTTFPVEYLSLGGIGPG